MDKVFIIMCRIMVAVSLVIFTAFGLALSEGNLSSGMFALLVLVVIVDLFLLEGFVKWCKQYRVWNHGVCRKNGKNWQLNEMKGLEHGRVTSMYEAGEYSCVITILTKSIGRRLKMDKVGCVGKINGVEVGRSKLVDKESFDFSLVSQVMEQAKKTGKVGTGEIKIFVVKEGE